MEKFTPNHLIIIIAVVVIGFGLIFKGAGNNELGNANPYAVGTKGTPVLSTAKPSAIPTISNSAANVPPPITRTENQVVKIDLEAVQLVAEIEDGVTYEYWTFNKTVPGPFIRVLEGDTVEVSVTHAHDHMAMNTLEPSIYEELFHSFTINSFVNVAQAQGHDHAPGMPDNHSHGNDSTMDHGSMSEAEHMAAGHGEHSIDLHAVQGPMGGADGSRAAPNATETFRFKAEKPGLYLYHCGSPHVATHIANGMYGVVLVEPKGGLPPVDKEFYLVEGELYTTGVVGQKGHHEFSIDKLMSESPEYVVFNGKPGALTGSNALTAEVGDTVRLFVAASGQVSSNFHVIGEIFDKVYREGDLLSPPAQNVQTTVVPAGGAMMTEFTVDYPATYAIVDHALSRALDRGAMAHLVVTGEPDPELYSKVE